MYDLLSTLMSEIDKKSFENPYEFSTLRKKIVKNFRIYFKKRFGRTLEKTEPGFGRRVQPKVRPNLRFRSCTNQVKAEEIS